MGRATYWQHVFSRLPWSHPPILGGVCGDCGGSLIANAFRVPGALSCAFSVRSASETGSTTDRGGRVRSPLPVLAVAVTAVIATIVLALGAAPGASAHSGGWYWGVPHTEVDDLDRTWSFTVHPVTRYRAVLTGWTCDDTDSEYTCDD
jgi:hypothetical protein